MDHQLIPGARHEGSALGTNEPGHSLTPQTANRRSRISTPNRTQARLERARGLMLLAFLAFAGTIAALFFIG